MFDITNAGHTITCSKSVTETATSKQCTILSVDCTISCTAWHSTTYSPSSLSSFLHWQESNLISFHVNWNSILSALFCHSHWSLHLWHALSCTLWYNWTLLKILLMDMHQPYGSWSTVGNIQCWYGNAHSCVDLQVTGHVNRLIGIN